MHAVKVAKSKHAAPSRHPGVGGVGVTHKDVLPYQKLLLCTPATATPSDPGGGSGGRGYMALKTLLARH